MRPAWIFDVEARLKHRLTSAILPSPLNRRGDLEIFRADPMVALANSDGVARRPAAVRSCHDVQHPRNFRESCSDKANTGASVCV